MPKYMYQAKYSVEGYRGLLKDTPSGRRKAVELAVQTLGGKVESFHYCFGSDDVVVILEMPDNITAAARTMPTALDASTWRGHFRAMTKCQPPLRQFNALRS